MPGSPSRGWSGNGSWVKTASTPTGSMPRIKDHFQNGDGWVGPVGGEDRERQSRTKTIVERQFTPVDVIGEVLDNLANALLQNKAQIALEPITPAPDGSDKEKAQQELAKKKLDIIMRWAEERKLWMKGRTVVKQSRWATWSTLRAWIPASAITPTATGQTGDPEGARPGAIRRAVTAVRNAVLPTEEPDRGEQQATIPLPQNLTLEDALSRIYLSAPGPDQGFVYVDPDTQRRVGIFLYADDRDEFAELCWVDDAGRTVFRTVSKKADADQVDHDLGKRLTLNQMEAELLITPPVRMQQAQLNFASSILTRVMETAGFAERYVVDAMPFGELTDTPPTDVPAIKVKTDDNGKEWYIIPREPNIGAGVLTEIRSLTDEDANGNETARTASVIFKEPTDPEYVIKAKKDARASVLSQCKQGHVVMDGEATTTGWSRVQARTTHIADVTNMRDPLVTLLRETLEAVLAYASLMSQEATDLLAEFRVVVQVHINVGPVSPEEQTAVLERLKAGAMSLPTALTLLQTDDVNAEIERIRSQPESQRATLKDQAEIGGVLIGQWGLDVVTVAELVGLPEEMVLLIKKADAMMQEQQQQLPPPQLDAQGNPIPPQNGNQPPNQNQPPNRDQPPRRQGAAA
jgi:hypothetical protein